MAQPLDEFATATLSDLAEALLLARDVTEAEQAREAVLEGLALLVTRQSMHDAIASIEWATLFFLIGLFVMVGALEETGALGRRSASGRT